MTSHGTCQIRSRGPKSWEGNTSNTVVLTSPIVLKKSTSEGSVMVLLCCRNSIHLTTMVWSLLLSLLSAAALIASSEEIKCYNCTSSTDIPECADYKFDYKHHSTCQNSSCFKIKTSYSRAGKYGTIIVGYSLHCRHLECL